MIIAFTGAGISKSSGIPTFQEQPEIRDKLTREFANKHPFEYREVMRQFVKAVEKAEPSWAHYTLNHFNIPVITMNIDGLHQKASGPSKQTIIPVHGRLPTREELPYCFELAETPVLYGDAAPRYSEALDLVRKMRLGDTLLVIGASDYTNFATQIRLEAITREASIVEIQDHADEKVLQFLKRRAEELR